MKQKSGFTLVELLLVVGISGIITTVTMLLVSQVELLKQSRDAIRISDLRSAQLLAVEINDRLEGVLVPKVSM